MYRKVISKITLSKLALEARSSFIALACAVLGIVISFLIGSIRPENSKDIVLESFLLALLFYSCLELWRCFNFINALKHSIEDAASLIDKRFTANDAQVFFAYNFLRVFEHEDGMVRSSLTKAIRALVPTINGDLKRTIEFVSPYVATTAYVSFWDQVRVAQSALSTCASVIKVFSAHASDLSVWDDEDVTRTQKQFTQNNGRIYRIIIRNEGARDTLERYNEVVSEMRSKNYRVFFLNVPIEQRVVTDDYFLSEVNNVKYCMSWDCDWRSRTGIIKKCIMSTDKDVIDNIHGRWLHLVDRLEKQRNNDFGPALSFLNDRPTKEDIEEMRSFY